MSKKVAPSIVTLFEAERTKRAEQAIDALLNIYQNRKDSLPKEVIDICEKHLVGYWDVRITPKVYKESKKRATAPKTTASS